MAGPTMGGMNPMLALLPPDQQQSYMQLQQQQALAQAMLQQGMQPQDMGQNPVGGMAYHVSPLNGVNKVLQTYLGTKMGMDSMGKQAQLMGQMYGNAFGTNQPQAQPQQASTDAGGMTDGQSGPGVQSMPVSAPGAAPSGAQIGAVMGGSAPAQAVPQQQMPNGALTLPGKTPQQSMLLFSMLGPDAYGKMLEAQTAPTAATLAARQGGMDPVTANRLAFRHDTYNAPIQGTGIMRDPFTHQPVAFNPEVPAGATPLFDASGNVAGVQPIQGAQGVMQGNAAATAAGGAQFKPVQVYNPATHQMEFSSEAAVTNPAVPAPVRNNNPGAMMPGGKLAQYPDMQTGLQALDQNLASYGKQGVNTISGVISKWAPPNENNTQAYIQDVSQRLGIPPGQKIDLSNPLQRQALSTAIALHENGPAGVFGGGGAAPQGGAPAAAPPLGTQAGAEAGSRNLQDELSKKWTDLSAANTQAQGVISNLQNIKTWGAKAATGPQSDRLNYANGLLSLAGSEKATDAVTANDLLNKYSNQITARLSAGGMGTDAARAILQSAYPNSNMTDAARNEAVDNLVGAQQMVQAKAKILAPLRNKGDAQGYNDTEVQFDQNADPRIFQYANIKDPTARAAFAKNLMQQDPTIVNKIQSLQKLGALQ
jgi:hypothetical protein